MILYRPVGLQELVLIYDSGMKAPCLRARTVLSLIPVSDTVKTFSFLLQEVLQSSLIHTFRKTVRVNIKLQHHSYAK